VRRNGLGIKSQTTVKVRLLKRALFSPPIFGRRSESALSATKHKRGVTYVVDWKKDWKTLVLIIGGFLVLYYLPVETLQGWGRLKTAAWESLYLARWYAREHMLFCLVPAFFIAGAIAVFISQASVIKYLGAGANKVLAYGVASVSGSILAVCSCTVLPLFAGIYRMGAGLGPATAFLYSGPAINVLAIILTARVLGLSLGVARAVGAMSFSVIIGLLMHLIFRREETEKADRAAALPELGVTRPLWHNVLYFASIVGILVFANLGHSGEEGGFWRLAYSAKWFLTAGASIALGAILVAWFGLRWSRALLAGAPVALLALLYTDRPAIPFAAAVITVSLITSTQRGELRDWFDSTWGFAKQITPLLLLGVLVAGLALGRPGHEGLIPSAWVAKSVGGNSLMANAFAAVAGAFMYFATLTEVPILQGLIGNGMGKGPALALLLAGPALSLPNMLVIRGIIGTKKTLVFVALVVAMASVSGMVYGSIF
jgi:uncharacterized membrane protein YraQ (UPF0718 family)